MTRLSLGISDHVGGGALPPLLARMSETEPSLLLEARVAPSRELRDCFERGELDVAIVRREGELEEGELLSVEPLGWYGLPSFQWSGEAPLRLATLSQLCGVRAVSLRALTEASIPFREVFVGGGMAAVAAAVAAGLGVAALSARTAPMGSLDVTSRLGLPDLPSMQIALLSRVSDAKRAAAVALIAATFRQERGLRTSHGASTRIRRELQ